MFALRRIRKMGIAASLLLAGSALACSPASYLEGDADAAFTRFFSSPIRSAYDLTARGEVEQGPHDVHLMFQSVHPVVLKEADRYKPCDPKEESKTFKRHFPFSRAVLAHSEKHECLKFELKGVEGGRVLLHDRQSATYFFRSWEEE